MDARRMKDNERTRCSTEVGRVKLGDNAQNRDAGEKERK